MFNHGLTDFKKFGALTLEKAHKTSWPTDVLNSERDIIPEPFIFPQAWQGKSYFLGYEHCDVVGKDWFWTADDRARPTEKLFELYDRTTKAGGNLLLGVGPDRGGRLAGWQIEALMKLKDACPSAGFARAPEGALDIAHVAAPLFRDPVTDGAADPSVVWHAKEKAWYVFYTQRRANAALPPAESWYMGTKIGIAKSSDQGRTWSCVGTAQGLSRGLKEETYWAPHVFEDNGTWHLFVTFIPKVVKSAKGQPEICHYTSRDLITWEFSDTADVKSDDIIDPGVVKLRDGNWLMVFRDCRKQNRTAKVVSPDLKNWKRLDVLTGDSHHKAPVVLFWKNKFWLFIDEWKGIGVYESDDGINYTRNNLILDKAGKRADDGYWGSHPGVALAGDRAFIFYHVHAGRRIGVDTMALDQKGVEFKRTSLQVAELELKDGKIVCDRDKYMPMR